MTMLLQILSILIPVLFAITLHEVGHGWVAKQFGDRTAEIQGRLTLNPIAHMAVSYTHLTLPTKA